MGACQGKKVVVEPQAAAPTVLDGRPEVAKPEAPVVESPTAVTPTTAGAEYKTDAGADADASPARAHAETPANAAQAVGEQAQEKEAAVDAHAGKAPEAVDSAVAVPPPMAANAEEAAAASAREPPASPVGVAELVALEEAKGDERAAQGQVVAPATEGHGTAVLRRERETCC